MTEPRRLLEPSDTWNPWAKSDDEPQWSPGICGDEEDKPTISFGREAALEFLQSQVATASILSDFRHVGTSTAYETADAEMNTGEVWPEGEEVLKKWQQRAQKSDELIIQLKHVVLAQHKKIEELQQRIKDDANVPPMPSYSVQLAIHSDMLEDSKKVVEANATLNEAVKGLKYQLTQARKENNTINKALKRYKNMVQEPIDMEESAMRTDVADPPRRSVDDLDMSRATKCLSRFRDEDDGDLELPWGKVKISKKSSMVRQGSMTLGSRGLKYARSHELLCKIITKIPVLCSNVYQADPTIILDRLCSVLQTITDNKAVISLFIIDQALWQAVNRRDQSDARKFYLSGNVVLHEYTPTNTQLSISAQRRPAFALEKIRIRKKDTFVQPLEKDSAIWAIIQVCMEMTSEEDTYPPMSPGGPPPPPQARMLTSLNSKRKTISKLKSEYDMAQPLTGATGCNMSEGLSDLIVAALVTVIQSAEWALSRWENGCLDADNVARRCSVVSLAAELFRATNWLDFEVRVKHGIKSVFDATARILIVDGGELVLSSAQAARKKKTQDAPILPKLERRFAIEKGAVGRCAQRRKVIRLNHMINSTFIDAKADGLDMFPMDSTALIGPLESVERITLGVFAVVQAVRTGKNQFSKADENLYSSIMVLAGEAGCRVVHT
eukprot:GEMP01019610.1.p1 GENE.GEMP01019610.1~~GEMP01019610.1.p1  ORF type:complete len:668 (+),score=137.27 GEMP01019610.1:223-2226(+)